MRNLSRMALAAAVAFTGLTFLGGPNPGPVQAPPRAPSGVALGRAYAPVLAATYADAWVAAAAALEQGKTVAEAQATLQQTWQEGRVRAFRAWVEPGFAQALPEGQEPADPATRAKVVALWRSFAGGLKAAR